MEIAEQFLSENHQIFSMNTNLTDLVHIRTLVRKDHNHVKFQQTYKSIPIVNAEYLIHIRPDGSIDMVNGLYFPEIDISINPQIDKNEASNIATSNLGKNIVLRRDLESQLVLYPVESNLYLSWEIIIPAKFPLGVWEYYIDANNGEIISKKNIMVSTTGNGNIYPTHPGLSSVTNSTLYRLDDSGYLKGTYADVKNYDGSRAHESNFSFNYSSNSLLFDEANVYYHIDKYKYNYIKWDLSFNGFNSIQANVHGENPANAFFFPATNPSNYELEFGNGDDYDTYDQYPNVYDFAKEDKVIYHEYTHAVSYYTAGIINHDGPEEGAINEGLSDYFPASYTNRVVIMDYSYPALQRNLTAPEVTNYSVYLSDPYYREVHRGGEFFSATLWDFRSNPNVGTSIADDIIFDALYRITSNPDFLSYRDAMISYDRAAYSGIYTNYIIGEFDDRGISGSVPLYIEIFGPDNLQKGSSGTFTAIASGGSMNYTNYKWWKSYNSATWTYLSQFQGQTIISTSGTSSFYLKCQVTDSDNNAAEYIHYVYVSTGGGDPLRKTISPFDDQFNNDYEFNLSANYPNPFNPTTKIRFSLKDANQIILNIYASDGSKIITLIDSFYEEGIYDIQWNGLNHNGNHVSSGIYFYELISGQNRMIKKMLKMQ